MKTKNHSRSKKNKKGMYVLIFTVLFYFLIVIAALYASIKYTDFGTAVTIGHDQIELLTLYQETEEDLLYLDLAANYAAQSALYDLMGEGISETGCGAYAGYTIWSDNTEDCFPDVNSNLLEDKFNQHMNIYSRDINYMPENNYDVSYYGGGDNIIFVADAKENLEVPLTDYGGSLRIETEETFSREGYRFFGSPNYNRLNRRNIQHVVLYASKTNSFEETSELYLNSESRQSSHYVVNKSGDVYQFVSETDIAFHITPIQDFGDQPRLVTISTSSVESGETGTTSPTNENSISIVLINLFDVCQRYESCLENNCCDSQVCQDYYQENDGVRCIENYDLEQINAIVLLLDAIESRHEEVQINLNIENIGPELISVLRPRLTRFSDRLVINE